MMTMMVMYFGTHELGTGVMLCYACVVGFEASSILRSSLFLNIYMYIFQNLVYRKVYINTSVSLALPFSILLSKYNYIETASKSSYGSFSFVELHGLPETQQARLAFEIH